MFPFKKKTVVNFPCKRLSINFLMNTPLNFLLIACEIEYIDIMSGETILTREIDTFLVNSHYEFRDFIDGHRHVYLTGN